jgi:hypothetical protein
VKDLGPQPKTGGAFMRRMRLHQSWYRAAVLDLPCGTGPQRESTRPLGNMLPSGDGEAGRNFLTSEIFAVVKQRLEENPDRVERFRVLHNMLSSQPMCFNLFAPLARDTALATELARALWGHQVSVVTRVVVEWAPEPAAEYLEDSTSFDAFVEYELTGGGLGFAGIETKLTEPFSQRLYDGPAYRRWMSADSPWREDAFDKVAQVVHNQLWRNHLLVWALLRRPGSPYREGRVVVVRHPCDEACARTVDDYRGLLRDEATFQDLPLHALLRSWMPAARENAWLLEFERRYLDLTGSQHHWESHRA